jgi:hypothetical protein
LLNAIMPGKLFICMCCSCCVCCQQQLLQHDAQPGV